jgi:hypothetical protein
MTEIPGITVQQSGSDDKPECPFFCRAGFLPLHPHADSFPCIPLWFLPRKLDAAQERLRRFAQSKREGQGGAGRGGPGRLE